MKYLLDTNICSYIIREEPLPILAKLQQVGVNDVGLPSIVLYEMRYGAHRRAAATLLKSIDRFVSRFQVVAFGAPEAEAAARVRAELELAGKPIGGFDVLIAAQAFANDLTLVTNNTREFSRVRGLKLENWALPS